MFKIIIALPDISLMFCKQVFSPKYSEGPNLNNAIMLTLHLYVMT